MANIKSVPQIIDIAAKAQYLAQTDIAKGGLYGGGLDIRLPLKLYNVRKNVQRIQSLDGILEDVRATAKVTITAIGTTGGTITITVDDPISGELELGSYTQAGGDTTPTILAASIYGALDTDLGYSYSVSGAQITITAPVNMGSQINGDNRLSKTISTSPAGPTVTLSQFSSGVTASAGDTNLRKTANYLYWLCGGYALRAAGISGEGGVAPVVANFDTPAPYDFTVTNTSFIIAGQSSKSIPNFIGYNLLFVRGGVVQSTEDLGDGSSYFIWDKNTGLFTIYPEAALSENFILYAQ